MLKRILLVLLILFQNVYCFAYEKQNDEYSCGAISAYNVIQEICPLCKNKDLNIIYKLLKTNTNGTTTYNLCKGLDNYFFEQNLSSNILYYGIKKVKTYKAGESVDLKKIQEFISSGYIAIINIGIYKKTPYRYVRQYGHYVNLISMDNNELKIFDPYDRENEYSYWKTKNTNIKLKNINDNEKYENTENNILIDSSINYLKQDELAIINGFILIKLSK